MKMVQTYFEIILFFHEFYCFKNNKQMHKFSFCLLLLFIQNFIFSQHFNSISYGVNEGLPSSQVYQIFQDKHGYLWFATDRGIAKYNGYEFETFEHKTGNLSPVIIDFHLQPNGQVWCSTINNELFRFNEEFTDFVHYPYNNVLTEYFNKSKTSHHIGSMVVDEQENINLSITKGSFIHKIKISSDGKLSKIRDKQIINQTKKDNRYLNTNIDDASTSFFYYSNTKTSNQFSAKSSSTLKLEAAYSKKSNLSFYLIDGKVHIVNQKGETVKIIKHNKTVLSINNLKDDRILVGYYFGGCKILDAYGNTLLELLPDKSITNGIIDHAEGLWLATHNSGVHYFENMNLNMFEIPKEKNVAINSLSKTNTNDLILGTDNGKAFLLQDDFSFKKIYESSLDNTPTSVQAYDTDTVLISSYGLHKFNKKTKNYTSSLKSLRLKKLPENKNNLVLVSVSNQVLLKNGNTIKFHTSIQDAISRNDTIYLSTNKGLFKTKNGTNFIQVTKERANDIDVNPWNNKLYIGTLGKGLKILDKNQVTHIDTSNGICNNFINEVYIEDEFTIWLATNGGINRIKFDKDDNITQITELNKENGLIDNEVRDIEIIGNTLWIATKQGLININKSYLEHHKKEFNHFLKFKNIEINQNKVEIPELNDLSYDENFLVFNVEGISYGKHQKLIYKYWLEGLNKTWYQTKSRKIRFSALRPGKYTLHVKSCKTSLDCNSHIIQQTFVIDPPFWKTWWFITFNCFVVILSIYFFFKIQVLTYNKGVAYELIRLVLKKLNKKEHYLTFREAGQDVKIKSNEVYFIEASGNYITIHTKERNYTVRLNISKFIDTASDAIEFIRIHRKYIVRIDKVVSKSKTKIVLINNKELPVGGTYIKDLDRIVTF